ncbi:MAG: rod shape-determining protein MreC [Acidimicrobiia bacterium]
MTLVLLVITSLVLITLDERGSAVFNSARSAAQDVIAPLQRAIDSVVNPVADFFDGLGRASEIEAENTRLRDENTKLQAEVDRGQVAVAENDRFREIFDIPQIADYDGVVAQVSTGSVDNFHKTWRVDKGSASGIAVDMPVVVGGNSGGALVGRVSSVARASAVIERIDDRDFQAGAQLVQGGAPGPTGAAQGIANSTQLSFQLFENGTTGIAIAKGDLVVTSGGVGSIYPKGLPIGRVTRSVPATAVVQRDTRLQPIVDMDRVDLVKILRNAGATPTG